MIFFYMMIFRGTPALFQRFFTAAGAYGLCTPASSQGIGEANGNSSGKPGQQLQGMHTIYIDLP